jgi:uncharacterized membrane protein YdjX (TVP38/TMEM64 family)
LELILLSQLHPLFPTSLMNYLYGLARIRLRTCLLWIAVGQAPGLFLYAYLGGLGQLGLRIARGETPSAFLRVLDLGCWSCAVCFAFADFGTSRNTINRNFK